MLPALHGLPAVLLPTADTVVARTLPVRDGLAWATDVLALLLLLGGVALVGAALWLATRISRLLERLADATDQAVRGLAPVLAEAEGVVADTRATLGVVRGDVEALSGSMAALGDDVRHAAAVANARVARLNEALETLQGEFEQSVRATVRMLRAVRHGARLVRRVLGGRRRRRHVASHRESRAPEP